MAFTHINVLFCRKLVRIDIYRIANIPKVDIIMVSYFNAQYVV